MRQSFFSQRSAGRVMRGQRGFTLNELVVSISIFGILTALVIANFSRGRLADDLRISAQILSSNLRRVQNLATVGQALNNGLVPPGGYGVSIPWAANSNTYDIFSDTAIIVASACVAATTNNPNSEYDPGPEPCDQLTELGTISLRSGVVLDAIKVGADITTFGAGSWDDDNRVDLAFKPPKPIPVLDGTTGQSVHIQLRQTKTGELRTITIIGASGQISERIGGLP